MMRKLLGFTFVLGLAVSTFATPPNTPILDGRPLEYAGGDAMASYTGGGGVFGAGNYLSHLYLTWDDTYLYIALQGAEADNKLVVMLDVDPDAGSGATTTTNWSGVDPSYIMYNDVGWKASDSNGAVLFGLDYQIASEGFYNNIIQVLYDGSGTPDSNTVAALFDQGNGATPRGSPVDMAVQSDDTTCGLKGLEARIPWSVLYPSAGPNAGRFGTVQSGETVPRGAQLRLFANIHNNVPGISYSANDAIPEQVSPNASWDAGLLTTDTYLDVLVDADNDGVPDMQAGDVNPPYIRAAVGAQGTKTVYVYFNEPVTQATAENTVNWEVDFVNPSSATLQGDSTVVLELDDALPLAGTIVSIVADGVEDASSNSRTAEFCLDPAASGLTNALTVRFVLETASGLGINPGASNFFVNGGSFPLEFGYPPATSGPLAQLSGTLYYRDVVFPPGTSTKLNYKYSGQLTNTGTNTYEAIRLQNYADAARVLTLPSDVASIVVTDYLGAAAGPYRDPGTNDGAVALFFDTQRGDAGVRERVTVTFQLDLSARDLRTVDRVLVQGTDPLRGFNYNPDSGEADWAGGGIVGWDMGGIELFDDGTHGDQVADDAIYSRQWALTDDGLDVDIEPEYPNGLVGGGFSVAPYYGSTWEERRSPRSMDYKFYVVKNDGNFLESPNSNIELYIEDAAGTNVVLSPFVWANDGLPPPPPSNAPTMLLSQPLNPTQVLVRLENLPTESQHGLWISTNLAQGWMDFGTRVVNGSGGSWTVLVNNANAQSEMYAAFAGPAKSSIGFYFEPNPLPETGGVLRIWYRQHGRNLAGFRNVGLTGDWNGWGDAKPMTAFVGDGVWYYDMIVTSGSPALITFKARSMTGEWDNDPDWRAYRGVGRATWTPSRPAPGGVLSITYNAAGGPLAAATNVMAHLGYEENWDNTSDIEMSQVGGTGTVWTLDVPVPTNTVLSVNFVFRNSAGTIWDSEGNPGTGGRQYRVFVDPYPYP